MTGKRYIVELYTNGNQWLARVSTGDDGDGGEVQNTPGAAVESALQAIDVFWLPVETEQKPATAT